MSASIIPLHAVPSQMFEVTLAQQPCRIAVYQRRERVYLDLHMNDAAIIIGAMAHDRSWLVRAPHTGFVGELYFMDMQGAADPIFDGLGTRFLLVYEDAP